MTILEMKSRKLYFGKTTLVESIDLQMSAGDCVWIQGPVGSGKSTFLRMLKSEFPEAQYLPQFRSFSTHLPFSLQEVSQMFSKAQNSERVLSEHQRRLSWSQASGGEKTLCLLEGILNSNSSLILLDELSAWLDSASRERATSIIQKALAEKKLAVVCAEHDSTLFAWTQIFEINNAKWLRHH